MTSSSPLFSATQQVKSIQPSGALRRWCVQGSMALAALAVSWSAAAQNTSAPLYAELPASIKNAKVLKFVGDSFAPYRIIGEDGKVTGIDADLAQALEKQLGVKVEVHIVSNLPAMLSGVDTGRYDLSTGPLLSTEAREKRYDMITWMLSKPAFVLQSTGERKVNKLMDLCGMRIAFPAGSSQEEYSKRVSDRCVAEGHAAMRYVPLSDQNTTVLAVQSGRADVTGMQLAAALYLEHRNPGKFYIQTDETDGLGVLLQGFVLKKGSDFSPVLLKALKQVWASGDYDQIMDKWGLSQTKDREPRMNPSTTR